MWSRPHVVVSLDHGTGRAREKVPLFVEVIQDNWIGGVDRGRDSLGGDVSLLASVDPGRWGEREASLGWEGGRGREGHVLGDGGGAAIRVGEWGEGGGGERGGSRGTLLGGQGEGFGAWVCGVTATAATAEGCVGDEDVATVSGVVVWCE